MEIKTRKNNKNTQQNLKLLQGTRSKLYSSLTVKHRSYDWIFYLLFAIISMLTCTAYAETSSEQLDPIDLLEIHLTENSSPADMLISSESPNISLSIWKSSTRTAPLQFATLSLADNVISTPETTKELIADILQNPSTPAKTIISKPVSPSQNDLPLTKSPVTDPKRQLQRSRISYPVENAENTKSKNELYRLAEKIRAVRFEPKNKPAAPMVILEPDPQTEPNEPAPEKTPPEEEKEKEGEQKNEPQPDIDQSGQNKLASELISSETLQMLKNISQHPENIKNPFELAEILYHNGYLKEAATCYQLALSRITQDNTNQPLIKPWILFQIGNCLRNDQPSVAAQMYKQLITEYPTLPWTDLAKTRTKFIDWYQQENPVSFIQEKPF